MFSLHWKKQDRNLNNSRILTALAFSTKLSFLQILRRRGWTSNAVPDKFKNGIQFYNGKRSRRDLRYSLCSYHVEDMLCNFIARTMFCCLLFCLSFSSFLIISWDAPSCNRMVKTYSYLWCFWAITRTSPLRNIEYIVSKKNMSYFVVLAPS